MACQDVCDWWEKISTGELSVMSVYVCDLNVNARNNKYQTRTRQNTKTNSKSNQTKTQQRQAFLLNKTNFDILNMHFCMQTQVKKTAYTKALLHVNHKLQFLRERVFESFEFRCCTRHKRNDSAGVPVQLFLHSNAVSQFQTLQNSLCVASIVSQHTHRGESGIRSDTISSKWQFISQTMI